MEMVKVKAVVMVPLEVEFETTRVRSIRELSEINAKKLMTKQKLRLPYNSIVNVLSTEIVKETESESSNS